MAKKNSPAAKHMPVTKNAPVAKKASATKNAPPSYKPAKRKISKALRFAHPFFTTKPKSKRRTVPGVGKGLSKYPSNAGLLQPIPAPQRNPTILLDEIIGT